MTVTLQEIRNQFEEVIQSLQDGVIIIDALSKIVFANHAAAEILEYNDKAGLIGVSMDDLYANPDDHDSLLSILGHRGEAEKSIFDWKKKDGSTTLIELTAKPVRNAEGHVAGFHGIFRDISKKLQSQIAQQETLAETAARSIDENKLLDIINFYQSIPMSLILQGVAHNLNTPLGTIRGRAELLIHQIRKNAHLCAAVSETKLQQDIEQFHAKLSKGLDEIVAQVDRASVLIHGFADKVSLEMNTVETEIDINKLVEQEFRFFESSLFFKHKVKKELRLDPTIKPIIGVYRDFSQAIYNLIVNSMKATSDKEERILIARTYQDDTFINIELEDNRELIPGDNSVYELSTNLDPRLDKIPEEARFSIYDLEVANVLRLLSAQQVEVEVFPDNLPKFIIRIPKSPVQA
ncbi:MAG: PAS domain-containing protein [Bacteroidetes bacterium]|nr:PAS domain-containing protein [Bacteroidota bacterium]